MVIRPVTLDDVPGLVRLHEGTEGPWGEVATCALWVNHRLLRPFICEVALLEGKVVGHAEWIASHEPAPIGFQLYLGMIEIHPDWRGRGIGSAMVQHGLKRAQKLGCGWLRTIPEETATGFYHKCGLTPEREIQAHRIAIQPSELPENWHIIRRVPKRVVESLPMRLGLAQASSAHMWEIYNRPLIVAGEPVRHRCAARKDDQAFVQLRRFGQRNSGLVLSWIAASVKGTEILNVAHALGAILGLEELSLMGYADEMSNFGDMGPCKERSWVWSVRIP